MSIACTTAGFGRRIGALVYDWFLLAGVLMIAQFMLVAAIAGLAYGGWIDLAPYGGEVSRYLVGKRLATLWLLFWIVGFYSFFWCYAGQTLGMKAWRLRVQNSDGSKLRTTQGIVRALSALLGFGNLMVLFSRPQRAWQDLVADCEVVVLPKAAKKPSGPAA